MTILAVTCKGQDGPPSGSYTPLKSTGWWWGRGVFDNLNIPHGGATPTLGPKQWQAAGPVYLDSINNIIYFWSSSSWHALGPGAGTPAGNYGAVQLKGIGNIFRATDSLLLDGGVLTNLATLKTGTATTSAGKVQVGNGDAVNPTITAGPTGTDFNAVTDPSIASDGWTAWYKFYGTDANITNNTTTHHRFNLLARKDSYFPVGPAVSQTFKFGNGMEWVWHVKDTVRGNPQLSDGIAGLRSRMVIVKNTGYTGRSSLGLGGTFGDAVATTLGIWEFKGTSGSNNINVNGTLSGFTSYIISDNGVNDTVKNFVGFLASGGGSGVPKILKRYDFLGGVVGNTSNTDSAWAFFSIHPTAASGAGAGTIRHVFGGPVSIDTTGLHTGPVEALEIWNGKIKIVDGSEGNGKVLTSDANGKASWATPSGGSGTPAGSSTQVQINTAGAFDANSGFTYNGSNQIHIGGGDIRDNGSNMRLIPSGGFEIFNATNYIMSLYNGAGADGIVITPYAFSINSMSGTTSLKIQDAAPSGKLGIGGAPGSDAKLDVISTTLGARAAPVMTTTQMNAISGPGLGLQCINSTMLMPMWFDGSSWRSSAPTTGSGSTTATAATTFTVTFGGTQPNSTYKVFVQPTSVLAAAPFYVTNKTATAFDITYLSAITGLVSFDWQVNQ